MMYSEKRCLEIYRVAREKNLFYAAHQRDHDSYELVLDYLLRQCDRFSLEIDVIYKNNQKTNWNEPQISAKLSPYFLEKRCVETESAWPRKNNSITTQFKEISLYRCCEESIAVLREYENFLSIDDQLDICFFTKEKMILHIISHEDQYLIDPNFFADLPEFLEREKTLFTESRHLREMDRETYRSLLQRYLTTCDRYTLSTHTSGSLEDPESVAYPCNEETIRVLEQYENFLSLGTQTSIAFYYQDTCVCYTIPDRELCIIDTLTYREKLAEKSNVADAIVASTVNLGNGTTYNKKYATLYYKWDYDGNTPYVEGDTNLAADNSLTQGETDYAFYKRKDPDRGDEQCLAVDIYAALEGSRGYWLLMVDHSDDNAPSDENYAGVFGDPDALCAMKDVFKVTAQNLIKINGKVVGDTETETYCAGQVFNFNIAMTYPDPDNNGDDLRKRKKVVYQLKMR